MQKPTLNRETVFAELAAFHAKSATLDIDALREDGFEGRTDADVTLDWVRHCYCGTPNLLLSELYEFATAKSVQVTGDPATLSVCKCCGYQTLYDPDAYDICGWCNWEDDGTTDPDRPSSVNRGTQTEYRARLVEQGKTQPFHRWLKPDPTR